MDLNTKQANFREELNLKRDETGETFSEDKEAFERSATIKNFFIIFKCSSRFNKEGKLSS